MNKHREDKEKAPAGEGAGCPSCGMTAVLDGRCWSCGRMSADTIDAGTPPDVEFDPLSRAFVFTKRWLTLYPILGMCLGLFTLTWFEKDLRGLLAGQGTVHPLLAVYLIVLTYLMAVFAVNRTTLRIHHDRLEVRRGPIPVPFAKPQVLTRDQVVAFTLFEDRNFQSNRVTYELHADTVGGGQVIVSFGRQGRETAARLCAFLQRTIRPSGSRKETAASGPASILDSYSPLYIIPIMVAGLLDGLVMELGVSWSFGRLFWSLLGGIFVGLFAAVYLYFRKNYHARSLERLQPGEQNPGPVFYLALAGSMTALLMPVSMFISNLLG